jgi:pimeloyl-ACP methyl ester carboxylesterase
MSECCPPADCAATCGLAACPSHPPPEPIVLAEARARFEREAERGTCPTGRYAMPYYSWGSGPPLVLIHGVSDSGHSFLMPASRLSAHFRCIAYELPTGHGDGARLRWYTHDHLVEDLWALLDHLGLERGYLLASSFGATVALKAMRQHPGRLPRAVLQGALAYRPLRRAERVLARLGRWLPGPASRIPFRKKVLRLVHAPLFAGRTPDVWDYFLEVTGRARIAAFARQALWLGDLDLRPILPEVRQPVLLVCGDRDTVVPPAYQEVLLRGLPNAGRVVLQGCGHTPSYTHPEALAEVVRRFLTPPCPHPPAPES